MITLTRSVTLVPITAPRDAGHVAPGAWGAVISDGEVATGFGLPFLLGTAELGEVNALRAALSGTVGVNPRDNGESASALQLRLMKLLVAERPPLSASQLADAAAAASAAAKARTHPTSRAVLLLPPIAMPPPLTAGGGAASRDGDAGRAAGANVDGVDDEALLDTADEMDDCELLGF